jgi:hypothetical protein
MAQRFLLCRSPSDTRTHRAGGAYFFPCRVPRCRSCPVSSNSSHTGTRSALAMATKVDAFTSIRCRSARANDMRCTPLRSATSVRLKPLAFRARLMLSTSRLVTHALPRVKRAGARVVPDSSRTLTERDRERLESHTTPWRMRTRSALSFACRRRSGRSVSGTSRHAHRSMSTPKVTPRKRPAGISSTRWCSSLRAAPSVARCKRCYVRQALFPRQGLLLRRAAPPRVKSR